MAEQGFSDEARAIREAWKQGDKEKAVQLVPDVLIETSVLLGRRLNAESVWKPIASQA